jgi:hypothetical protein
MGKRSTFDRSPQDAYDTPREAVEPLIPHLPSALLFWEPCAGSGDLVSHISSLHPKAWLIGAYDIEPRADIVERLDAFSFDAKGAGYIITNPPWTRSILHPMIEHFSDMAPTWLLFDADWMHTRQSVPYLPRLRKIVSVGRVKWMPDSPHTGKDNCAWYLFDKPSDQPPQFYGRTA